MYFLYIVILKSYSQLYLFLIPYRQNVPYRYTLWGDGMSSDVKNQIYKAIESISDKRKLKIILQFILGIIGD